MSKKLMKMKILKDISQNKKSNLNSMKRNLKKLKT